MKIVDKIVNIVLSLCILPTAIFAPIIHVIYQIQGLEILEKLIGSGVFPANDSGLTEDFFSLWWIYKNIFKGGLSLHEINISDVPESVKAILPFLKFSAILFAVGVVIGLVLVIVSVVTRAKKAQCVLCAVGIVDLIVCGVFFSKFASPIVSGAVSAGTLLQSVLGESFSAAGSIATSTIFDVQRLNLSSAWSVIIVIFIAVIVWNVSYILTDNGEKAVKK